MMLKHTLIFLILVVAISSAIPPDIPQLNPDDGVLFDSLPEDAYERGRVCVSEFLDIYLDDYSLGDAELLYAYGYGLEQIALAFIFTSSYDSISWDDYYVFNNYYLKIGDSILKGEYESLSLEDPLFVEHYNLIEQRDNYKMVVVAFANNKPVVLSCTIVPLSFSLRSTQPSITTQPGITRLGYIIMLMRIIYSGDDEEIIIQYKYGQFFEDGYNSSNLIHGVNYDLSNYENRRKPRYYEIWGIRNTLAGPVCTSFD